VVVAVIGLSPTSEGDFRSPYRWTVIAAAVAGALAPAYVTRWHIGPLPTTLLEAAILLTILVFALETAARRAPIELRSPLTLPAALLLLAGAVSILVSADRRGALGLYRAYFLEPAAFCLIVAAVCVTARRAGVVLLGFAAGGVLVAVLNGAVVLQAIRHHVLNLATTPPVVIYQTANDVALYLVPLIAVAGALLLYATTRAERVLSAVFLLISVPAVVLSFSRGGYLALVAVGLGLALSHRRARLLVPVFVLAILALSQLPLIKPRIAYELHAVPGNTLDFRIRIWGQTLRLLSHHPVLGIGLSNYKQAMGPFWQDLPQVIYPHNIVLNFWAVTGLLGLIAFAWLTGQAFLMALRGWRRDPAAWRPYELGVFLFLIGMIVHGLVDVPFFKNDLSLQYWAFLGVLWAAWRWAKRAPERPVG
jgi:O-antigen ligase